MMIPELMVITNYITVLIRMDITGNDIGVCSKIVPFMVIFYITY